MAKFEGKTKTFFIAKDLDWPDTMPGNLVAVYHEDWGFGRPVIEGWRGPQIESEDFARLRLEPYPCKHLMTDMGGYWDCLRGTIIGASKRRGGRHPVRPVVQRLIEAVAFDVFPDSAAVLVDFEISDQAHYEALYYPIRAGEITAEDLDRVLGDPEAITELVNKAPSNPHKGIVFGGR